MMSIAQGSFSTITSEMPRLMIGAPSKAIGLAEAFCQTMVLAGMAGEVRFSSWRGGELTKAFGNEHYSIRHDQIERNKCSERCEAEPSQAKPSILKSGGNTSDDGSGHCQDRMETRRGSDIFVPACFWFYYMNHTIHRVIDAACAAKMFTGNMYIR